MTDKEPEVPATAATARPRRADGRFTSASGAAARAKPRRVKELTLERVERELGPLETPADAMRRLGLLSVWAAAGLLRAGTSNAA